MFWKSFAHSTSSNKNGDLHRAAVFSTWDAASASDDSFSRADRSAGAAIDTFIWINPACVVFLADSIGWALAFACAAVYTSIGNLIGHCSLLAWKS